MWRWVGQEMAIGVSWWRILTGDQDIGWTFGVALVHWQEILLIELEFFMFQIA
jgi:hypothetical protein